jgi:heme/copper-type cytochrome/quinol oxidase subunit 2
MGLNARLAAILVLVALLLPALLSACPLCKEAEADTPGGSASLGRGFYYSILLMIAVPWTAVGTVAFLIFRKRRRSGKVAGTGPAGLHPPPPSTLRETAVAGLVPESRGARS